jgi:PAS domain S-box-containing protein
MQAVERHEIDPQQSILETLELVTKQMGVAVSRCSDDLRYLWANQEYANWIHRPLNEIVGRPMVDVLGKEAFEALSPHFKRVLTGERVHYERETNFQGIGRRWTSSTYTPTLDANGVANGWVAVVLDITERKLADEVLRRSEERFRLAALAGRMFACEWDAATDVAVRSADFAQVLGIEQPMETNSQQMLGRIHRDDRERVKAAFAALTPENPQFKISYRMQHHDDAIIWVEGTSRAQFDEQGRMQRIVGMVADVTERHQAEAALRESEERFRLVANTAPVMIWMTGLDKKPTYFNQLWLDFTGLSEKDLINGLGGIVHPDDYQQGLDAYCRGFDQRQPIRKECRLRRRDGEYRWMLDIGVPRFHRDGSFAGYIGSCVDVTDHKLAEEALSGMTRKLVQAQEQERARIARELHDDVNQRLALLAVELQQVGDDPSLVRSRVPELRQQVTDISNDIQAVAHDLHSSNLEYLGVAAAMKSWCKEFAERQNMEIDFRHDVRNILPREAGVCLFRVLQEALHNAAKHSGVKRIKVELYEKSDEIHFIVSDTGRGFDVEAVKQGHGLGLTSMQERVRLVNGTIGIESRPMRGTTIHVRVPIDSKFGVERAAG